MRYLFQEYGGVVINGIVASFLAILFFTQLYPSIISTVAYSIENVVTPSSVTLNDQLYAPVLVVTSCVIPTHSSFNYQNYVVAYTNTGKDISKDVRIFKGSVDTSKPGKYEITYRVTCNGVSTYRRGVYLVEGKT